MKLWLCNMNNKSNLLITLLITICLGTIFYWVFSSFTNQPTTREVKTRFFELSDLLSRASVSNDNAFQKALNPKAFSFPQDHLAHPDFRSEWWYFTGHLSDPQSPQKTFGYQFTLFRQAVTPPQVKTSPWSTPQLYMAHFAITNIEQNSHRATEKFSREGPGLAGTSLKPLSLWIENWRLQSVQPDSLFPLRLITTDNTHKISLDLMLAPEKTFILQGNEGLSKKSFEPGNASYYYSYTRLGTSGSVKWDDTKTPVEGRSWFDHEWSTSALNSNQQGWDWFSLQLENGYDLMYFRIRSTHKESATQAITLIDPKGNKIPVDTSNIALTELSHWVSPNGKQYPAKWLFELPKHQIKLTLTPKVADQEMRLSVNYWEGAVNVEGSHRGLGYVELTGY